MSRGNGDLLARLSAINSALCVANRTMGELLVEELGDRRASQLPADELRSVSTKLVSLGGDMTSLGVEMGMIANRWGQGHS